MKTINVLDPEPLYIQLKRDLQREILERNLPPGTKLWSEKELQERSGASTITVRKALSELCKEGWVYKRQGMGTYVAEWGKEADVSSEDPVKNIAFILCGRASIDAFYSRVLHGAERASYGNGYHLVYHSIGAEKESDLDSKIERLIKGNPLSGGIITGQIPSAAVTAVRRSALPCVFVGDIAQKRITTKRVHIVAFDDRGAAFAGTNYLIALNHRRIGFLSGPLRYSWWIQMFEGYKDALRQAEIGFNRNLSVQCDADSVEEGHRAVNELLALDPVPTAIMATNDMLAIGAIRGIREKGLKVPEDISIVGIGDYEIGRYYEPALTTLGCPAEELGKKAVEMLLRYDIARAPTRLVLPYQLIVRKSCTRVMED